MKSSILYLMLILLATSCATVYSPQSIVPKYFHKAQDVSINTSVGGTGLNTELAYTPIKHLFFSAAINSTIDIFYKNIQLGAGYYTTYKSTYIETEFGLRKGNFDLINFQRKAGYKYKGNYSNIFSSFLVSQKRSKSIHLGFGMRVSLNNYYFDTYRNPFNSSYEIPGQKTSDLNFKKVLQFEVNAFLTKRIIPRLDFFCEIGAFVPSLTIYSYLIQTRIGFKFNIRKRVF